MRWVEWLDILWIGRWGVSTRSSSFQAWTAGLLQPCMMPGKQRRSTSLGKGFWKRSAWFQTGCVESLRLPGEQNSIKLKLASLKGGLGCYIKFCESVLAPCLLNTSLVTENRANQGYCVLQRVTKGGGLERKWEVCEHLAWVWFPSFGSTGCQNCHLQASRFWRCGWVLRGLLIRLLPPQPPCCLYSSWLWGGSLASCPEQVEQWPPRARSHTANASLERKEGPSVL